jgi:hypothetical protein
VKSLDSGFATSYASCQLIEQSTPKIEVYSDGDHFSHPEYLIVSVLRIFGIAPASFLSFLFFRFDETLSKVRL